MDICSGCTGHWGFWTSWVEARDVVLQAIRTAAAINPGFRIAITGHSLGGAIASLAAAELRNEGYMLALVIGRAYSPTTSYICSYIASIRSALLDSETKPSARISLINRVVITALRTTTIQSHVYRLCWSVMPILVRNTISRPLISSLLRLLISGYAQAIRNSDCNGAWVIPDILAHIEYFDIMGALLSTSGCLVGAEVLGGCSARCLSTKGTNYAWAQ